MNVGDASIRVVVRATWDCSIDVGPESTLMERGGVGIRNMTQQHATHRAGIMQGEKQVTPGTPNPVTWISQGDVTGCERMGFLSAMIGYFDKGAEPGHVLVSMSATYSVSPDTGE